MILAYRAGMIESQERHYVQTNQYDEFQVLARDGSRSHGALDRVLWRKQFREE